MSDISYKDLLYKWLISRDSNYSIEEVLLVSDFADFLDMRTDEITTLRAQLAESQKTNERLVCRLNWIRINSNDGVALHFALEATDEEIDDVKHLITESE